MSEQSDKLKSFCPVVQGLFSQINSLQPVQNIQFTVTRDIENHQVLTVKMPQLSNVWQGLNSRHVCNMTRYDKIRVFHLLNQH